MKTNGWLRSWIHHHARTIVLREIIRQDRISAPWTPSVPGPCGSPRPHCSSSTGWDWAAVTAAKPGGLDALFLCSRPDWCYWWSPLDTCVIPDTWRGFCTSLRLEETSAENMHISGFVSIWTILKILAKSDKTHRPPWSAGTYVERVWTVLKPVLSRWGVFVDIAKNTFSIHFKMTNFSFMPKIIRMLSKDHVPWRYFVHFLP